MKTFKTLLAALPLFAVLLAGCSSPSQTPETPQTPGGRVELTTTTVAIDAFSAIHTRRNVVVRDATAWAALWAAHNAERSPVPPLPAVNFNTQMLVGIFAGDRRGCHEFEIRSVSVAGGRIVVEYEERDISATTICIAAITNPMHVVAIPRSDAEMVFTRITPARLEFTTIARTQRSGVEEPLAVVVRDRRTWNALWRRHAGPGQVPNINFRTSMVIAVFRGTLPNGCYSTEITDVYRTGSGLTVSRVDTEPGQDVVCTLAIVTPAHLISVPRVDDPVRFVVERRALP